VSRFFEDGNRINSRSSFRRDKCGNSSNDECYGQDRPDRRDIGRGDSKENATDEPRRQHSDQQASTGTSCEKNEGLPEHE
jgi:hypothetical protein